MKTEEEWGDIFSPKVITRIGNASKTKTRLFAVNSLKLDYSNGVLALVYTNNDSLDKEQACIVTDEIVKFEPAWKSLIALEVTDRCYEDVIRKLRGPIGINEPKEEPVLCPFCNEPIEIVNNEPFGGYLFSHHGKTELCPLATDNDGECKLVQWNYSDPDTLKAVLTTRPIEDELKAKIEKLNIELAETQACLLERNIQLDVVQKTNNWMSIPKPPETD